MERAARVLRKAKQSQSILDDSQALEAVWPTAVGKAIVRHVSKLRRVRTTLVVEVEDAIWQRQLRLLEHQIVGRIRMLLPDLEIHDMEFRVGVPRREAQRAGTPSGVAVERLSTPNSDDEADRISDPVLKKIYQMSRRKASA
jgi:hypothetical protein